jgi:hypothetical protein
LIHGSWLRHEIANARSSGGCSFDHLGVCIDGCSIKPLTSGLGGIIVASLH